MALVGREQETALLYAAVDDALAGRGRFVLIAGEPGIGKTSLAETAVAYATENGARALWGASWEGEGTPPYWPWMQIVRSYAAGRRTDELYNEMGAGASDIARLVPEVGGRFLTLTAAEEAEPDQARFRLFDNVTLFLKEAARSQPLVLVFDDLHWADRSSLTLLLFFAQALRDASVLAIGTYRDVDLDADHPLRETHRTTERVFLRGLQRDEVAALIRETTGSDPQPELADGVFDKTNGNPFFVKEVARLLDAQGRLHSGGYAIPEGVRDVVGKRLARLDQQTVALLGAASVLGREFSIDQLASLADRDVEGVLRLLDDATSAQIVSEQPETVGRFAFAHALVRDSLYSELGPARRAALHWKAGSLLDARHLGDAHLSEIANHLVRGAAAGDPSRAAEAAIGAGRYALRMYAWDKAAEMYTRALDALALAGSDDKVRARTLLELGDAHTRAGDLAAARGVYLRAADLSRGPELASELAHAALGLGGGLAGSEVRLFDDHQLELLDRALDELPATDAPVRAWVLARLSVASSFVRTIEERAALSREAVDMARRLGDRGALSYALSSLCDALAGPDHVNERLAASSEMIALASQPADGAARCGVDSCSVCLCDPEFALLGRRFRVVANLERGDLAAVDADIDGYARLAEHLRQPLYLWYVPLLRGMRALIRGSFGETERRIEEAAGIAERMSSDNANVLIGVLRAGLEIERGDTAAAVRAMRSIYAASSELSDIPSYPGAEVMFASLSGDKEEATRLLRGWIGRGGLSAQPKDSEWLSDGAIAADSALVIGDPVGAQHVFDALAPYEDLFAVDGIAAYFRGSVAYHLGRLAALLGRPDEAERLLAKATAAHERIGAPLWSERSRSDAAAPPAAAVKPVEEGRFRREGDFWTVAYDGEVARLKDSKGLRDIAALLATPDKEIAALDLASAEAGRFEGDAGELLDERARAAYKARIAELQAEIDEDPSGSTRAREELDALSEQLAAAYGLGGRARRAGDPAERARKAVTERIRDAVGKIARQTPALGRHLKASIHTGAFCSYEPERPVTWTF